MVLIWIPVCPRCGKTNYQPLGGGVRICLNCGQAWVQHGPDEPSARVRADAALAMAGTQEANRARSA
jgi:hypothetical protein